MKLSNIPTYVWTLASLLVGIVLGGTFPEALSPVTRATRFIIQFIVTLVPLLILAALSPAVATLVGRGRAGRFAGVVVSWYVISSALAGLFGLVLSVLVFRIPLVTGSGSALAEAGKMIASFREQSGASLPLVAIVAAVVLGVVSVRFDRLGRLLDLVGGAIARAGHWIGVVMVPLIFMFGVTLGVRFGARLGTAHYFAMTAYTAVLCLAWWMFYVFVIVRIVGRRPAGPIIRQYYLPTAAFAAGTCSSLATLPVNLSNIKKVGVRDEVADFVIPFGAVANLDASTLMYVAYAPFVMTFIFDLPLSITTMLIAWPALVLFTIAAPGLPAGMGTALWTSTLFASMAGLQDPFRAEFIATWIALAGGLPDMFRTATNCTSDGFAAVALDARFEEWFGRPAIGNRQSVIGNR